MKDLELTCTAVGWRPDSERREPRCHPSEKSSHTVPPASSCSTAHNLETGAENTTVTYSRHNRLLIWRSRDMTEQSLITLAPRRQSWTHWTWHGLVLIVAEFCNASCLEKEELKRSNYYICKNIKPQKKENYPNVCSLINDTVTLHIKELWCSVGDGAPLSGPILEEKVYKHDSCNVLMRWSFIISAAERFSDLTWTVMASRDPRTSILALFMEPKSINTGRSFSSSKTLVGFKSLFSEIKQHIKYCIYCT